MASGWDFEYRVWRISRDPQGYEDAELYRTYQVGSARGYWRQSADGAWMPRGHDRGNVSPVMIWRKPATDPNDGPPGHGLGWSPFGTLEGTSDVRCGDWPEPRVVFERTNVAAAVDLAPTPR